MSRTVQLELTLEVEVECDYDKEYGWLITRLNEVKLGPRIVTHARMSDVLSYSQTLREKLIELYIQQEP